MMIGITIIYNRVYTTHNGKKDNKNAKFLYVS